MKIIIFHFHFALSLPFHSTWLVYPFARGPTKSALTQSTLFVFFHILFDFIYYFFCLCLSSLFVRMVKSVAVPHSRWPNAYNFIFSFRLCFLSTHILFLFFWWPIRITIHRPLWINISIYRSQYADFSISPSTFISIHLHSPSSMRRNMTQTCCCSTSSFAGYNDVHCHRHCVLAREHRYSCAALQWNFPGHFADKGRPRWPSDKLICFALCGR